MRTILYLFHDQRPNDIWIILLWGIKEYILANKIPRRQFKTTIISQNFEESSLTIVLESSGILRSTNIHIIGVRSHPKSLSLLCMKWGNLAGLATTEKYTQNGILHDIMDVIYTLVWANMIKFKYSVDLNGKRNSMWKTLYIFWFFT